MTSRAAASVPTSPPGVHADAHGPLTARRLLSQVGLPWLVTRVFLLAAALLYLGRFPAGPGDGAWGRISRMEWVNALTRWDGYWYLAIAGNGYSFMPGERSTVAFWPLLPAAMKLGGLALGRDDPEGWAIAGILVTNLALVVALAVLLATVRREFDGNVALRSVLYLLVFPSTIFLSALYPESVYLAAALAALYCARGGRWRLAGLCGALAALARIQGMLLVVPLAYEYLAQRRAAGRGLSWDALAVGGPLLAFAGWAAYLWSLSGDPLLALRAGAAWRRQLSVPWALITSLGNGSLAFHGYGPSVLDLLFAAGFLGLTLMTWRMLPRVYAVYSTVLLLAMISSGQLISIPRYGMELFPVFMVLALWGSNRVFHLLFLVLSGALALVFAMLFAGGFWIA